MIPPKIAKQKEPAGLQVSYLTALRVINYSYDGSQILLDAHI